MSKIYALQPGDDDWFWKEYLRHINGTSAAIVLALMTDLTDRRGLEQEFLMCDDDVKKEIIDTWISLVKECLPSEAKEGGNE